MARNQKLTGVIGGRRLRQVRADGEALVFGFDDGSTMTVRTSASPSISAANGIVRAVRQQDTTLALDLTDGRTLTVTTAEATASVMVRDSKGELEYAD